MYTLELEDVIQNSRTLLEIFFFFFILIRYKYIPLFFFRDLQIL